MAGLFAGGAMAQDLPAPGVWLYEKKTDEFTDEIEHRLYLVAEKISASKDVVLVIICKNNETNSNIITTGYVLNKTYDSDDIWEVDYRVDELKASKFKVLSTNTSFGPYSQSTEIPLIKSMFNHDKLRLRFQTYDGIRETVTFKITDIETEIKPLREACNW